MTEWERSIASLAFFFLKQAVLIIGPLALLAVCLYKLRGWMTFKKNIEK